jgi:hydroxyacylglutathione hydrolase
MEIRQYYLDCLAHASYMISDESSKTAIVIDPQRDIYQYLADAERAGFTIKHVFLTHFHADFVAGHMELKMKTNAEIHLGAQATADFEFTPMPDQSILEIGQTRLQILETPGHTPEGISIVVYDLAESATQPHAVLSGDTLFIGDVGRPDLMASVGASAEGLASSLYDSLHDKLLQLPDATLLFPAHGAGSMCGKNLSQDKVSTIGAQRESNYALQPMSKDDFVALVTADQPIAPSYFSYDAELNRTSPGLLDDAMNNMKSLTVGELQKLMAEKGAQLVDTRRPDDFAQSHMLGSINIELEGKFATWAGTLLDPKRPIVLIADTGAETEALLRLGRIGFDLVAGYLESGVQALAGSPELMGHIDRLSSSELAKELTTKKPLVLDVRTKGEFDAGHIPSAVNLPLGELPSRLSELPSDRRIVATCRTGSRSSTALSLLRAAGFAQSVDQRGGFEAWQERQKTNEMNINNTTN